MPKTRNIKVKFVLSPKDIRVKSYYETVDIEVPFELTMLEYDEIIEQEYKKWRDKYISTYWLVLEE